MTTVHLESVVKLEKTVVVSVRDGVRIEVRLHPRAPVLAGGFCYGLADSGVGVLAEGSLNFMNDCIRRCSLRPRYGSKRKCQNQRKECCNFLHSVLSLG